MTDLTLPPRFSTAIVKAVFISSAVCLEFAAQPTIRREVAIDEIGRRPMRRIAFRGGLEPRSLHASDAVLSHRLAGGIKTDLVALLDEIRMDSQRSIHAAGTHVRSFDLLQERFGGFGFSFLFLASRDPTVIAGMTDLENSKHGFHSEFSLVRVHERKDRLGVFNVSFANQAAAFLGSHSPLSNTPSLRPCDDVWRSLTNQTRSMTRRPTSESSERSARIRAPAMPRFDRSSGDRRSVAETAPDMFFYPWIYPCEKVWKGCGKLMEIIFLSPQKCTRFST